MESNQLYDYIVGIGDNALILGQRLGELCGHGPNLETDIALTNISLDLFGQTRSYFQYAAKIGSGNSTEDDIAFLRPEHEYRNALLVEQPNTNFAYVITKQFLFDSYHLLFLQRLVNSKDETLAAIASKAIKEVSYHERFSSDWMKRLGDGTEESHEKTQIAVDDLWRYTKELFSMTENEIEMAEKGIAVNVDQLESEYYERVSDLLKTATLQTPENPYFAKGGKKGVHTEHMGYILADMQFMQRAYPNMKW